MEGKKEGREKIKIGRYICTLQVSWGRAKASSKVRRKGVL